MLSEKTDLAQRRAEAQTATRDASILSGLLGAATGLCAFVPGLGIVTGLLFAHFGEKRWDDRVIRHMCEELVRIYLPDSDATAETAELLANRRDPNKSGAFARAVNTATSTAMNTMRDLESTALVGTLELLAKIMLPFGIGALLGFLVNFWETRRLGRWARDRLEILADVPESERERYVDRSGWCGCVLVIVLVAAIALTVWAVVAIVQAF